MKRLLSLTSLLLLTASPAFASENLRDLLFFPAEGTIWGSTGYSSQESTYKINDNKTEASEKKINQNLFYKFDENTALAVELTKVMDDTIKSGGDTYESDGFENPIFAIIRKVQNQKDGDFDAFFALAISPDLLEAKDSSTTKKGTAASGGFSLTGNTYIGKKIDANQHQFTLAIRMDSKQKQEVAEGSGENKTDADNTISAKYNYQRDFTETLSLGGEITYSRFSKMISESPSNKVTRDAYGQFAFGVNAKYLVLPNLLLTAEYTSLLATDVDGTSGKASTTNLKYKDIQASLISFRVAYKF